MICEDRQFCSRRAGDMLSFDKYLEKLSPLGDELQVFIDIVLINYPTITQTQYLFCRAEPKVSSEQILPFGFAEEYCITMITNKIKIHICDLNSARHK